MVKHFKLNLDMSVFHHLDPNFLRQRFSTMSVFGDPLLGLQNGWRTPPWTMLIRFIIFNILHLQVIVPQTRTSCLFVCLAFPQSWCVVQKANAKP